MLKKICHEIGNPLTLIDSNVQLMSHKYSDLEKLPEWIQLQEDLKHLRGLFHSLSQYNNCELGKVETTDLYELLYETCDSYENYASTYHVYLDYKEENLIPCAAAYPCDPIRIRQAIGNLIKNAIENAITETTILISIQAGDDNSIILNVENHGPALLPTRLAQLTSPFYTTRQGGYGLGLPITESIVQKHGGSLSIHSDNGINTFSIILPNALR